MRTPPREVKQGRSGLLASFETYGGGLLAIKKRNEGPVATQTYSRVAQGGIANPFSTGAGS
jgi:hypothetical protein